MNPAPDDDLRRAAFVFLTGIAVMAVVLALLAEALR